MRHAPSRADEGQYLNFDPVSKPRGFTAPETISIAMLLYQGTISSHIEGK
jgi:hypothetical protein